MSAVVIDNCFNQPHDSVNGVKPDRTTKFELLDRVTCSTSSYTVPIGLRGVVIGIEPSNINPV